MKKNKIVLYSILSAMVVFMPIMANAASDIGSVSVSATDVPKIIAKVAAAMYNVVLALAVVFLIWAAFLYLSGDPKKVAKAHKQIINAVIAIIIAIIAFSAKAIIQSFLGGK